MSQAAYYSRYNKYSRKVVKCPDCKMQLRFKDYEKRHVLQCRQSKLTTACIFCTGNQRQRWDSGKRNFKHIIPCLDKFIKKYGVTCPDDGDDMPMESEETPIPCVECKHFCSVPRDMLGRTKDSTSKYIYDSVFEQPEDYWKSDIQFSEESGLGRDINGIVQKYLKRDMEWYHLKVTSENFDNFVNAMEEMKDRMFLLPFWCLCDDKTMKGGMHRHMIIAVEPGAPFKQLLRTKVEYDFGDETKSKNCIRIQNAFHLIRTIQYVSQRKSMCDGTQAESTCQCSPFHINRPLHEHAMVCMCTLFEGGMERLLKEQLRNKDVARWFQHLEKKRDAKQPLTYAVPIGRTGFKFINCVLPLASYFEPSDKPTDVYLTWIGNRKMYLRVNPSLTNLSRKAWYAHQAAKGNIVWSIRDECYVLGPRQQNVTDQIKAAVEMVRNSWRQKTREMEQKLADKHAALEVKYAQSKAEYMRLAMEKERMEEENESWMLQCQNFQK